jgi:phenylacetic acid degradation operon negative regulatory protein
VKLDAAVAPHLARLIADRPPRAGSLVVTAFGDAVVPHGGAIWLGSLIRWLADFGVQERAVRTAVHRLTADDWFTVTSSGRRSDYRLTRESRQLRGRRRPSPPRLLGDKPGGSWCSVTDVAVETRDRARHDFAISLRRARAGRPRPSADVAELARARRPRPACAIVLRARATTVCRKPGLDRGSSSAWDLRHLANRARAPVPPFAGRLAAGAHLAGNLFSVADLFIHDTVILLRDRASRRASPGRKSAEARRVRGITAPSSARSRVPPDFPSAAYIAFARTIFCSGLRNRRGRAN